MSISSDGARVAIGGNVNGFGVTRIYQFDDDNNSWSQVGNDIAGGANDQSGYSVSLSSGGLIVAIGAPNNGGNGSSSGRTRIYEFDNTTTNWIQLGNDIDGESAGDYSGYSVSLSADGGQVAIGAPMNGGNGSTSGHTRIYEFDNTSNQWTQVGSDIDGEAAGDQSGYSVSLSADGGQVAIGSPMNDGGNGSTSGHTRIYKKENFGWTQVGSDIDGEAADDWSDYSVSLSSDGTRVAIGSMWNNAGAGHTRVYELDNNGEWVQLGGDIDGDTSNDNTGFTVSLSLDGSRVAIGSFSFVSVRIYEFK